MRTLTLFVTVGLACQGCITTEKKSIDQISGTYAKEYSIVVVNPETGAEIGVRTVRDSIFIRSIADEFEVSNHKWSKNDYDDEGWRNMEHADDRPIATFISVINRDRQSLDLNSLPQLFLVLERRQLFKGADRSKPYQKSE